MNTLELLTENELPNGFVYPRELKRMLNLGLINLEPWHLLAGERLRFNMAGLAERYPKLKLIPFAYRQDNDDFACWQFEIPGTVFIIHDFALGHEHRGQFVDFYAWLRRAIEDFIEFDT